VIRPQTPIGSWRIRVEPRSSSNLNSRSTSIAVCRWPAPSTVWKPVLSDSGALDAAAMLFWLRGYHPVSTDAICRAAGVKKGSLYFAFPAKTDILMACLESIGDSEWAEMQSTYSRPGGIEARFREHLEWYALSQRPLKERAGIVLGSFDMALGVAIPESVLPRMAAYRALHRGRLDRSIEELLGAGPDSAATAGWLADVVAQLITGATIRARLSDDLVALEKLPETVFSLIGAVVSKKIDHNATKRSVG
jgi:TetR/AcrR family transcriptional repressor of nem operon